MSQTPSGVGDPGYVRPGTGQTEKSEDRNEAPAKEEETAPDGSTVLPADDQPEEAEES